MESKTIFDIINELKLFSDTIILKNAPTNKIEVVEFENTLNMKLPTDYKLFLEYSNGLILGGTEVYGLDKNKYSLKDCYEFEHNAVFNPMFEYLIPFSPDGGGNHYCFNVRKMNYISCEIVFWQHNYIYHKNDGPESTHESFTEWAKDVLINWTLEEFDYNGISK